MRMLLTILFILPPLLGQSQTFYVSSNDPKSKEHVENKIKFEGYSLVDSSTANYVVELLIDGKYKVVSFKRSYQGYIRIMNNNTGEEVTRTKVIKRNPVALNGFNAAFDIFSTIAKRYLPAELKKCKTTI